MGADYVYCLKYDIILTKKHHLLPFRFRIRSYHRFLRYPAAMSSPRHSRHLSLVLTCLLILCQPWPVLAAPSEAELVIAKDSFQQLSQHAVTAIYKRAQLEQRLEKVDANVSAAKKSLEQVVLSKRFVRERILERQQLMSALSGQILAVRSNQRFYEQITLSERQTLVEFIRYLAAKDVVMTDTGPVAGYNRSTSHLRRTRWCRSWYRSRHEPG